MINGGASLAQRTHRDLKELWEVNLVGGNEGNKVAKEVQTGMGGRPCLRRIQISPAQQVYFLRVRSDSGLVFKLAAKSSVVMPDAY